MRDHLTHRYFDTDHAIVAATVEQDLPALVAAARRLLDRVESTRRRPEPIAPGTTAGSPATPSGTDEPPPGEA